MPDTPKRPEKSSSELQQVALSSVTKLLNVPSPASLRDLKPVDGQAPSGERVHLQPSAWQVVEVPHQYVNTIEAKLGIGNVIDSAYISLSPNQRQRARITYSSELITDLRYETTDGQYRVRIYSPLTDKKQLETGTGYTKNDLAEALQQEGNDPRLTTPPTEGFLVSIQKVSTRTASGETSDKTDTFMALSIQGEQDPDLRFETLDQLVNAITRGIKKEMNLLPTRILTKIRTGADLSVLRDPQNPSRNDDFVHAAYDYNIVEHPAVVLNEQTGEVDLDFVWSAINDPSVMTAEISAEVEVNADSDIIKEMAIKEKRGNNMAQAYAGRISAFLDPTPPSTLTHISSNPPPDLSD